MRDEGEEWKLDNSIEMNKWNIHLEIFRMRISYDHHQMISYDLMNLWINGCLCCELTFSFHKNIWFHQLDQNFGTYLQKYYFFLLLFQVLYSLTISSIANYCNCWWWVESLWYDAKRHLFVWPFFNNLWLKFCARTECSHGGIHCAVIALLMLQMLQHIVLFHTVVIQSKWLYCYDRAW